MTKFILALILLLGTINAIADPLTSYRRLLPLEGGSNFRDLGGYLTSSGEYVVRGKLFRSAAMSALTENDEAFLNQFAFKTIVDLRSNEEIDLYPNNWAEDTKINYLKGDYPFTALITANGGDTPTNTSALYPKLLDIIHPVVKRYFHAALNDHAPIVVNCSAGQDRTGITAGLMLSVLGVPREVVLEDYLLSTDFRRPLVEGGGVDLEEAAKTNAFAAIMLKIQEASHAPDRPNSLLSDDRIPYLQHVFDHIDEKYGSIEAYTSAELDINPADITRLKHLYLTDTR